MTRIIIDKNINSTAISTYDYDHDVESKSIVDNNVNLKKRKKKTIKKSMNRN